jgi:hypothetical protein
MTSMMLFQALELVIFLLGLPLCWPMQRTIELTTTFTRHWIGKTSSSCAIMNSML